MGWVNKVRFYSTILTIRGLEAYASKGLDMHWYGRTWEFLNLVWFSVKGTSAGWGPKGLDCTHGVRPSAAISQMHKYFLMAMVEDDMRVRD